MDRLYKKTDLRRTGVMKFVKKNIRKTNLLVATIMYGN